MGVRDHFAAVGIALGALGFGLGCSGLAESVVSMSGSEIQQGDDAQMPADFPIPHPPGHDKPITVVKMPMGELSMTTVAFEIEDPMAHEAFYKQHFEDANQTVKTETTEVMGTKSVVIATHDQTQSVLLSESFSGNSISLVTMTKTGAGTD